jgi:2-dehydropantoate 2-reductase
MLQDLESGRRTEIDYLNGAIVRMDRDVGIDTPFHQSIVALIHAREQV